MPLPLPPGQYAVPVISGTDQALQGPRVTDYRFDVLDENEHLVGELSTVTGGTLEWVSRTAIHGGGTIDVTDPGPATQISPQAVAAADVDWLNARIRVTVIYSRADIPTTVEQPLGVFLTAAPVEKWAAVGRSWTVELVDKLSILDRDIVTDVNGDPIVYSVGAGTNIIDTVRTLITDTGEAAPAIIDHAAVTSSPLTWDMGTSRLTIANDLLDAGNFMSLRCDAAGQYRTGTFVAQEDRPPVYALLAPFVEGPTSLMAPDWELDQDVYDVPNRYVAITSGTGDTAALTSVAENLDPDSPYSYGARGRWVTRVLTNAEAADQDALDAIARRGLTATTSVAAVITVQNVYLPDLLMNSVIWFKNYASGLWCLCEVNKLSVPLDPLALCRTELLEVLGTRTPIPVTPPVVARTWRRTVIDNTGASDVASAAESSPGTITASNSAGTSDSARFTAAYQYTNTVGSTDVFPSPVKDTAQVVFRLNTGTTVITATDGGIDWAADTMYSGGTQEAPIGDSISVTGVTNPAPTSVYQRERWGTFSYTITGLAASTSHTVRLHCVENYYSTANARKMTVTAQGSTVVNALDIYATVGKLHAIVPSFTCVSDGSGQIVLGFSASPGEATLCGIEILATASATDRVVVTVNTAGSSDSYVRDPALTSDWPSGLPFGSGAYVNNDVTRLTAMGAWRGATMDINVEFSQRDTWSNLLNPWWDIRETDATVLSLAVPLWPENGDVAAAAAGSYDSNWATLAGLLRDGDLLRLGWEMNMPMWHWKATPSNLSQWRAAWARAYDALKAARPGLKIVYNPGADNPAGQTGLSDIRDTIVEGKLDVIGLDIYDWWPGTTSETVWNQKLNDAGYLNWWLNEATTRGLKFALCEWAVAANDGSNGAAGDNPLWINHMFTWLGANAAHIDHETYFDETGWGGFAVYPTTQNPNSAAEYLARIAALKGT